MIAQAPSGSIASATVLAPSGDSACDDLRPRALGASLEADGVELEIEATIRFPGKRTAMLASCRARGTSPDERPLKQFAVLAKNKRIEQIVLAGDEASYLEGVVPFL